MKIRLLSVIVLVAVSSLAYALDGALVYKAKCSGCHGKEKVGAKLAATTKSEADIIALLTKGGAAKGPHMKPMSVTADQAKGVASFVKASK